MSVSLNRRWSLILLVALAAASFSCLRAAREDYPSLITSGNQFLEKKDYVRAILQFKNAARLEPRNAEPLYRLGLAYLESGSITDGVTSLVKATDLDPKHAGAQLKLAELLANSQDRKLLEDGRKRLEGILAASPANSDALTALAVTESRLGNLESAETDLLQALRSSPASLKAAVVLARVKLARGEVQAAEQVLRAAAQESPKATAPRLAMADLLLLVNRPQDAEKELRAALDLEPGNLRASLGLAGIYYASGRKDAAAEIYRRVSQTGDARFRHLYGAFLFNEGKREDALREFERLAHQDPDDRDARSRLVSAYLVLKRGQDADKLLEAALLRNPRDVDALLLKSEILLRDGRLDEAQNNLLEVLRFKPESAAAHYMLARVYGLRGAGRLQLQELSRALQAGPEQLTARIELARLYLDSNSPRLALDLLDQAPASQRRNTTFLVARNHALLAVGNIDEFAKGVAEGLSLARVPDLLVQDAQWKLSRRQFAAARESLAEALRKNPEHLGALDVLSRVRDAENGQGAGLSALSEHAARYPKSAKLQYYLGERMLAAGRRDEARRCFSGAVAADRGFAQAHLASAQMAYEDGDLASARRSLAALPRAVSEGPPAQLLMAAVESKAGNIPAAEQRYRNVLQADPDQVVALNNLAFLLASRENRADEAFGYAQRAKELAPDNPDVSGTIGWLCYRRGLYPTALQHLQAAVSRDGSASGARPAARRYYLGMTYLKLGDRRQGMEILEQSLRSHPTLPEAELARAAIREATKPPAR